MKSIRIHEYGGPEVLRYEDVPEPTPGPGQTLIKVESVAVNYADLIRRRNDTYPFPTTLPFTPGGEVAGVVEALGDGVAGPAVGTPVFALIGNDGSNGYAQYAVANANQVIPIPPGLNADQACALVVAGVTAVLILKEAARLQVGESVLVQGAAGGVGSYAVQIAKLLGAGMVIGATSSPEKGELALQLGADHVVDYTQPGWPEQVRALTGGQGVDVMLEMAGGQVFEQSLACLAPFGRQVVYGAASRKADELSPQALLNLLYAPAPNQSLFGFNIGLWFALQPQSAISALQTLINFVMAGQVQIQISQTLPLSRAAEAHRMIESRRTTGKIVLKPWVEQ